MKLSNKEKDTKSSNLQSQMLYAPFISAIDKVKKRVEDLSYSDIEPKRYALSYDPPVIVLEYMVPSTGKLYHHKMRLRALTKDMEIDDMMKYLEKRHPLYFMNPQLKKDQIRSLIERLQFKMKGSAKVPLKTRSDMQKLPSMDLPEKPGAFKAGSKLPTIEDDPSKKENKSKVQFKETDDFEDAFGSEFDDDEDFDSEELLDLNKVQAQRASAAQQKPLGSSNGPKGITGGVGSTSISQPKAPTLNQQKTHTVVGADEAFDLDDDESDDGWGEDDFSDLKKFDYKNTDLNKMSDFQLNRHKQNMEKDFTSKVLRPGDKGFQYDKRKDFSSHIQEAKDDENSWDEDNDENQDEDYFDDDFA